MLLPPELHKGILSIFAVVSLLGNGLLILLVSHQHTRSLGSYRTLLVAFATLRIDFIFEIEVLYQFEFGVIVFIIAGLHHPFGLFINAFYVILFYEPFILLAFHFFYRYLVVACPHIVQQRGLLIALLAICINILFSLATFAICFLVKDAGGVVEGVMRDEFRVSNISSAHLFAIHYFLPKGDVNWETLLAIAIAISEAFAALGISCCCAYRISRGISTRVIAVGARRLQLQLFRALIVQFIAPLVLCIVPLACIALLPTTGIRFGETGNFLGLAVSLFRVIDPIMVIMMISRRVIASTSQRLIILNARSMSTRNGVAVVYFMAFRLLIVYYFNKTAGAIPYMASLRSTHFSSRSTVCSHVGAGT